jgi:hypothetical protein
MSDTTALVLVGEKVAGCTVYHGSSDTVDSRIHRTVDEAWKVRHTADSWAKCACGKEPTTVRILSFYGLETSWESEACFHCMAIVGDRGPYIELGWGQERTAKEVEAGIPDWLPKSREEWEKQIAEFLSGSNIAS